jgi:hypothetical protein
MAICNSLPDEFIRRIVSPMVLKASVISKPAALTSGFASFLFTPKKRSNVSALLPEEVYASLMAPFVRWAWEQLPTEPGKSKLASDVADHQLRLYNVLCKMVDKYLPIMPKELMRNIGTRVRASISVCSVSIA